MTSFVVVNCRNWKWIHIFIILKFLMVCIWVLQAINLHGSHYIHNCQPSTTRPQLYHIINKIRLAVVFWSNSDEVCKTFWNWFKHFKDMGNQMPSPPLLQGLIYCHHKHHYILMHVQQAAITVCLAGARQANPANNFNPRLLGWEFSPRCLRELIK